MKLIALKSLKIYAKNQAIISKTAYNLARAYIDKFGIDDTETFCNYVYGLIGKYGSASVSMAMKMYNELAILQKANVSDAEETDFPTLENIKQKIYSGLNSGLNSDQIANIAQNEIKQLSEDTVLHNAARDHAEYAWIPQGGETCAFCMEIASLGWRPASKAMLNGAHADHIHANCQCEFMIRFSDDYDVQDYNPNSYKRIITDLDGESMKAKNRALERQYYADDSEE